MNQLYITLASFALVIVGSVSSASNGCFRAAVVELVHQVERDSQAKSIKLNLDVLESAAKLAKQNGADIVVFPEDGILNDNTRKDAIQFGERLPDPKMMAICNSSNFSSTHPILNRLSCIAKTNQMFVGADMVDVQPCHNSSKVKCPSDNLYAFNTAVLFDREGHLLAKYHKIHLFGEMSKNLPPTEELVVVDTEIGRLGLQVCFDMIFKTPGHKLASEHLIDTLVFPTWWFDESPFLSSTQVQMSWSFVHKVNVLAANIHFPPLASKGSGIYDGAQQQFEVIDVIDGKSRLLVATLPINASTPKEKCPMNATTLEVKDIQPNINPLNPVTSFYMSLNITGTSLLKLDAHNEHALNCHGGVCCHLEYQMDRASLVAEDEFFLMASNRTKPFLIPFEEEFCALIHCPKRAGVDTCGLIQSPDPLKSKFHFAELYGEFSVNSTVFPSVIGSQREVMKRDGNMWSFEQFKSKTQKLIVTVGERNGTKSYPIGTVALYGRPFDRDPPFVQVDIGILG